MTTSTSTVSLRLELSERHGHDATTGKDTGLSVGQSPTSTSTSNASTPTRKKTSKVEESEYYDIELDELPLPITRTGSTDKLVRVESFMSKSPVPSWKDENTNTTEISPAAVDDAKSRPDYKSIPLQRPFLVFLLVFMAGLFAFLEYQIHDLPPMHYSVIHFDPPEAMQARVAIPPSHSQLWLPSMTESHTSSTKTATLVKMTPTPEPSPRPPEESFPNPLVPEYTRCGWKAPTWTVQRYVDNQCDGFTCEDWPIICSGNRSEVACIRSFLFENVDTFTTDDQSWCPCQLFLPFFTWGSGDALLDPDWVDSGDPGCKSIMLAIQSFNHYKTTELDYKTAVRIQDAEYTQLLSQYDTYTTPPLPVTGFWAYPSIKANGDIMMPLVTRAAGTEDKDVFGNKVGPADSALFPDQFQSRSMTGDQGMPATCWVNNIKNRDHGDDVLEGCMQTGLSTVWWALPLSRAALSTTEEPVSTTTEESIATTTSSDLRQPRKGEPTPSSQSSGNTRNGDNMVTPTSSASVSSTLAPSASVSSTRTPSSSGNSVDTRASTSSNKTPFAAAGKTTQVSSSKPSEEPSLSHDSVLNTLLSTTSSTTTNKPLSEISSSPSSLSSSPPSLSSSPSLFTSSSSTTPPLLSIIPIIPINSTLSHPTNNSNPPNHTTPGNTSPHPGGPILPEAQAVFHNLRSELDYLMASVIPVLLATLLSIPIQVFTASLSRTYPLRALTHPGPSGASASDSLCLSLSGGGGDINPLSPFLVGVRFLRRYGDPLPLLGFVVGTLAVLIVPVSSEVVRLEYTTECSKGGMTLMTASERVCAFGVRKVGVLIRVAEGMLVVMGVVVVVLGVLVARWRSGVATEPWSIAGMAGLLASDRGVEVAGLLRSLPARGLDADGRKIRDMDGQVEDVLREKRFRLGSVKGASGLSGAYGLRVITPPHPEDKEPIRQTTREPPKRRPTISERASKIWLILPSNKNMDLYLRILIFLFTLGLLVLILHYELTVGPDTPFERFMNSESFGVRILFTAFGSVVDAFWGYYFSYISEPQIHHRLSTPNQPQGHAANMSILLSPPSNVFVGLWRSILYFKLKPKTSAYPINNTIIDTKSNGRNTTTSTKTHKPTNWQEILTLNISLATLLSKFTPILFSNIPFSNTVTWKIHEACTWMAVIILSYMLVILLTSLLLSVPWSLVRRLWSMTNKGPAVTGGRINERNERFFRAGGRKEGKEKTGSGSTCHMPVKVDTMAGYMYYLCESRMVKDFEGVLGMGHKERDRLVCEMAKRYFFGEIRGESGVRRIGVDYVQDRAI